MRYLLLIYNDERGWDDMSEDEQAAQLPRWNAYTESLQSAGILRGGDALQPTASATTVRVRDGETQLTDGPFAETREQLGGFYLVEAKDLDEAIDLAARIPSSRVGTIEVRPIMPTARPE